MEFKTYGFEDVQHLDVGQSIFIYNKAPEDYKEANCYINSFHLCSNMVLKRGVKISAVFGYVLSSNSERKVAVRHAWNELDHGAYKTIVDVTMIANNENPISMLGYTYLPIDRYSATEFSDGIGNNNMCADLPVTDKERCYIKELKEKGFEVLGNE